MRCVYVTLAVNFSPDRYDNLQVDWDSTEFCYAPIVQSRGTSTGYDLRANAESSMDMMAHKGVLLVAVGMRYKAYCSNVGRTFIVDPSKVV